jgi:hypothetical protein
MVKFWVLIIDGCSLNRRLLLMNHLAQFERRTHPTDPVERKPGDGGDGGPTKPKVDRPDTQDLLKRMRRVDPNQARRYRQRTGQ